MRVAQINVTSNHGSTGRIAACICAKVIENDGNAIIIYGRDSNFTKEETFRFNSKLDVAMHYLNNRLRDREGLCSRRPTQKVIRALSEFQPDIVHLHNIHDHWLNYPALFEYLRASGVKVVWTFHDCWAYTGHCYHYEAANCRKWETECFNCPLISKLHIDNSRRNFSLKKLYFGGLGKNLTIVCVSNWLAENVKKSFFKDNSIKIIGNGIDTDTFKPDHRKSTTGRFRVVGVASSWSESKGFSDYLKLAKLLNPDFFEVMLVGLSLKQMRSLSGNVIGIPRTQNIQELVSLYNSGDLILSLSKGETFGLSIIEGLACGKPVLVYNNTAQPELINPDVGRVVKNGDISEVARLIEDIANKKIVFDSHKCRNVALNYNQDTQYQKYIELYREILNIS